MELLDQGDVEGVSASHVVAVGPRWAEQVAPLPARDLELTSSTTAGGGSAAPASLTTRQPDGGRLCCASTGEPASHFRHVRSQALSKCSTVQSGDCRALTDRFGQKLAN